MPGLAVRSRSVLVCILRSGERRGRYENPGNGLYALIESHRLGLYVQQYARCVYRSLVFPSVFTELTATDSN